MNTDSIHKADSPLGDKVKHGCQSPECVEASKAHWKKREQFIHAHFWSKADVIDDCFCWNWKHINKGHRYGQFSIHGVNQSAHRVAWKLTFGEIPEGLFVCHKCDNPPCVNPSHLFLGTALENTHDCINKGRKVSCPGEANGMYGVRGEAHPSSILEDEQVMDIRKRYAARHTNQKGLAMEFGVSQHLISCIVRGTTWKHLPVLPRMKAWNQLTKEQIEQVRVRFVPGLKTGPNARTALAKEFGVPPYIIGHCWNRVRHTTE